MRKYWKKMISLAILAVFFGGMIYADTVKLDVFFYKQEIKDALKKMGDVFTQKNPNITVEFEMIPNDSMTVLKTRMSGGQAPTLIQLQSYSAVFEFAKAGWLLDLSKEPVMSKVVDSAKGAVTYKGKQYSLPMDLAGIGIIYNKDIFDKYNLKPPVTFSDLKAVCAALKKNGITPFASMFKPNWSVGHFISMVHTSLTGSKLMPWMDSMNSGKGSFADPINKDDLFKIIDFYKDNSDPKAAEFDWNEQQASFAKGEAAMMVQGLWSYGAAISTNPKLNCGFIAFPCTDNPKDSKLFADVDSTFAISATASPDKMSAAKTFLEWLSSPEAIKMWIEDCKLVPTFKGANVKSMQQPFQDLVGYVGKGDVNPWAFSMYPVAVFEDGCKNGTQEYILGRKNADQVIAYIDDLWKQNTGK